MADSATHTHHAALALEFESARELIAARMGTTQSTIARLECGIRPPSLRTLQRYSKAVGARAVVRIVA